VGWDGGLIDLIWVKREREYIFNEDWTGKITLISKEKFFPARRRLRIPQARLQAPASTSQPVIPGRAEKREPGI
jgi:hypothetical protein